MRATLALVLALTACGGGAPEKRVALETRSGQSLVGAWDAQLSLTRPYQLELHEPATKRICGTIGFVENHYAGALADGAPHVGVYDLDLGQLGLNWRDDDSFPTALATAVDDLRRPTGPVGDSVAILLNPGNAERIVLLGRYDVAGINGRWTAQSSRGTASGFFALTPHVAERYPSRC
jgi:hypothetical protein